MKPLLLQDPKTESFSICNTTLEICLFNKTEEHLTFMLLNPSLPAGDEQQGRQAVGSPGEQQAAEGSQGHSSSCCRDPKGSLEGASRFLSHTAESQAGSSSQGLF